MWLLYLCQTLKSDIMHVVPGCSKDQASEQKEPEWEQVKHHVYQVKGRRDPDSGCHSGDATEVYFEDLATKDAPLYPRTLRRKWNRRCLLDFWSEESCGWWCYALGTGKLEERLSTGEKVEFYAVRTQCEIRMTWRGWRGNRRRKADPRSLI